MSRWLMSMRLGNQRNIRTGSVLAMVLAMLLVAMLIGLALIKTVLMHHRQLHVLAVEDRHLRPEPVPDGVAAEEVVELCRDLNDAGIQHLIFNMPNVHEIEPLETFGEKIIPAVAEL